MPKNEDIKPRGKMTAYAFFVQTCREEHKRKHPEEQVVFTEFSRKCADRWKTMSDYEKKRFNMMADCDKRRFDSEMATFNAESHKPTADGRKPQKKKKIKDPNAPKRNISAFFFFSTEEREKLKKEGNAEMKLMDASKEIGKRWAAIDPEVKAKFEKMAEDDKIRYAKEMEEFKQQKKNGIVDTTADSSDSE